MKKHIAVALILAASSAVASAQSSVTLYGIIDVGILYVNNANGAKQWSEFPAGLQGNRWGLKGSEDLGGGLKAIFTVENGFFVNNGAFAQGGAEFGRQAFVGLSSRFGTVTLGRQYDSIVDYLTPMKAGGTTVGAFSDHPGDLDNTGNDYRVNNSIKYASPDFKGLSFSGLFSLGGFAGSFERNRIYSVGAGYQGGPLQLGAAYLVARNPNFSYYGNNPNSSVTGNNMSSVVAFSGYASAQALQIIGAAGGYTFGPATVQVLYTNVQFQNFAPGSALNPQGLGGKAIFNTWEGNFRVYLAPDLMVGAAYNYTRGSDATRGNAGGVTYQQLHLGVDYFLSKRTDVYAVVFGQHASGRDSTGKGAVAQVFTLSPSSTSNQIATIVSLRHKF
ncbi:porin [Caballeronia sp. GaOx3]|uniref:porin n=1 Tax=Caballeronia sp. GaOx3 TaxID=2921740 RepID=UPI0020295552|nr:porin [Caballeronia sp. GaOx3]